MSTYTERYALLVQYARCRNGKPIACTPPKKVREERARWGLKPLKRKYIFDSPQIARDYADALMKLLPDSKPTRVYVCPFSGTEHSHITTNLKEEKFHAATATASR